MGMRKNFVYRLELNGKRVESGVVANHEMVRSAALYNASQLHHHEIKVYIGYEGENKMEYMGTCQPDGTFMDSFGKSRKIDEEGKYMVRP